jgi:hypothetical protein
MPFGGTFFWSTSKLPTVKMSKFKLSTLILPTVLSPNTCCGHPHSPCGGLSGWGQVNVDTVSMFWYFDGRKFGSRHQNVDHPTYGLDRIGSNKVEKEVVYPTAM